MGSALTWSGGKRRGLIMTGLLLAMSYVAIAIVTDADRLIGALRELKWFGCAAVLALSAINYILRFYRWRYFLAKLGRTLPPWRQLLYYLAGFAFTISPAKAGEVVRSFYVKEHGVTFGESLAAFFVERLLDLLAIVMLASLVVIDYPAYRLLIVASFLTVAVVIVVVGRPSVPRLINRLATRSGPRVSKIADRFSALLRSSALLLRPQPVILGVVIGLIAWGAEGMGFAAICQGLSIEGSALSFCGIYAVAVLAGSVAFFLPAGIGGTELVMTTLLVERGASLKIAIIATLLCRLATLWFAVVVGAMAALAVELNPATPSAVAYRSP